MNTYERLAEQISSIPLIDVHTHIDLSHVSARGLHDVLLYHMVISELYSAGCPDAGRLPEWPDKAEIQNRLQNAVAFIPYIKHSSTFSIVKRILGDLYGFCGEVTADNWKTIHSAISERYQCGYAEEIIEMAGIEALNTEHCRKHGLENSRFFYSLEWAFFTRNQYGIYDAPLLELEVASAQPTPEGPIPVTMDEVQYACRRRIKTVEQVDDAVEDYVSKIPFDSIVSLPTHFSTDIRYTEVTKDQMAKAMENRSSAGEAERDTYANYINAKYLEILDSQNKKTALAISVGAEPLKFETASKLDARTLYAIEAMANSYENIDFIIFNGCDYQDNTLSAIIRETRNVYAAGFWWHHYYPSSICQSIVGRLERLPLNKWFGYFSDAYCVDWAYGKSMLIRDCFARTLSQLVDQRRFSLDDAVFIANQLLYQNAKDYFKL